MDEKLLNEYWTDIYFLLHYPHKEKVTHQVIRIMQLIEKKETVGIGDVADYFGISPNTASEHVKRIIEKGLIVKNRDKADERKVILALTTLGQKVLQHNTSLDSEKLKQVLVGMTEEERQHIESAFQLLRERSIHVCSD
ncbi:MarR family transcriptional regulator [Sediminibacillus dalangtanensis]|uniref:MarR family transcriptional regulator n=1 Tax=Sediminibacillus dalangtanensis TaxID=2729421 RepID=A0ABX7VWT2_9BACI|nr:MarR family winged helix-turn-helix transcriptional regulator [Sediminibacillus dalangtanensis]QTN01422.1 MarR family transcriptional regulator [Sediminibacillus dalangtanensis]